MASSGNINKGIQLIIDVIYCKMLKEKYLVGLLSAHPIKATSHSTIFHIPMRPLRDDQRHRQRFNR